MKRVLTVLAVLTLAVSISIPAAMAKTYQMGIAHLGKAREKRNENY